MIKTIDMVQGQKVSRIIDWTFLNTSQRKSGVCYLNTRIESFSKSRLHRSSNNARYLRFMESDKKLFLIKETQIGNAL